MGIVFRQSVKSTLVIFAGALLGALTIFISTKYIPQQQFGIIKYITNQAVVASQVTMIGMNIVLAIYIHKYKDDDPRKPVLITISLIIPIAATVLLSALYFLFKPFILTSLYQPADRAYMDTFYVLVPVFTLLWTVLLLLEHYLNSQMKVAKSVLMREVVVRLLNIGVVLLYIFNYIGLNALIIGSVLIYIVPIIFLWFFCRQTTGFYLSFNWKILSRAEHKDILHFAWYHMLVGISINLLGYLDSLMLAPLDKNGMTSVAEYTVAVFVISFLQIPYRAMATASLPDLTKSYEAGDMALVESYFKRSAINTLIAAIGMYVVIVFNMDNVVRILDKNYASVYWLVVILALGRLADISTGLNNEMISISKHYKFSFYLSLLLVLLIFAFNWYLIPRIGVFGAAWGTTLALVVFNITKYIFLWRKMRLQPFTKASAMALAAGGAAAAAGYALPFILNPFVDAAIRSVLILSVYGGLLLALRPSEDLNHFLSAVKRNKRLF